MIGVEHIENWRGQKVRDPDDEELGKLEEVYFDAASGTPLLIAVKSGLLGRKSTLIPIDEALVGRDYVRVAHRKEVVGDAGTTRATETPGAEDLAAVGSAYGLRFSDRIQLRSATEIETARAQAEAAHEQAERLEAEAEEKAAAHQAAQERAQTAGQDLGQTEADAEQARQAAELARRQADRYDQP